MRPSGGELYRALTSGLDSIHTEQRRITVGALSDAELDALNYYINRKRSRHTQNPQTTGPVNSSVATLVVIEMQRRAHEKQPQQPRTSPASLTCFEPPVLSVSNVGNTTFHALIHRRADTDQEAAANASTNSSAFFPSREFDQANVARYRYNPYDPKKSIVFL